MKITGSLILYIIMLTFLVSNAKADTLLVCKGCPAPYFTDIQSAVDKASAGDTVYVSGGVYYEHVNINKPLTLIGAGAVVDANFTGSAITLNADNITLNGFTARNSGTDIENAGIEVNSNGNVLEGNIAENNYNGMFILGDQNTLKDNIVSSDLYGFYMFFSNQNNMFNNAAISNTNFGFYLSNSQDNYIEASTADSNDIGMYLDTSANSTISTSKITDNSEGAHMTNSSNNHVHNNIIQDNNDIGFYVESSSNNYIYNNLLNNTINAYDDGNNFWNITKRTGTNIIGGSYIGGNYWSDYSGVDSDGDGIGDDPYLGILDLGGTGVDYLPLVRQTGEGFDTGSGSYPTIMGTHNGTLMLNKSIIVGKMYTYPSPGTGGHSEYAAFYYPNGTLLASGNWTGYQGDWYNITFSQPFTLEANTNYNYTITTGSYPQIIHARNLTTSGGDIITCSEFTDANGRRYTDWIPAIKLEEQ